MQFPRRTENDMNNDAAFLSLLSSQRQLLNQINFESALQRQQSDETGPFDRNEGQPLFQPDHMVVATNLPIGRKDRNLDDMLRPKRLSIGLGFDDFQAGPPITDGNRHGDCKIDFLDSDFIQKSEGKFDPDIENFPGRKKKLLSDVGVASLLEEVQQFRMLPDAHSEDVSKVARVANDNNVVTKDNVFNSCDVKQTNSLSPAEVLVIVESFSSAMEESQNSQQAIHDWDKKMGLKRSHCKTMRLTARSRKKLRSMIKKQIKALSSQINIQ